MAHRACLLGQRTAGSSLIAEDSGGIGDAWPPAHIGRNGPSLLSIDSNLAGDVAGRGAFIQVRADHACVTRVEATTSFPISGRKHAGRRLLSRINDQLGSRAKLDVFVFRDELRSMSSR